MAAPLLAITLGDPRGIGPEIVAKALARPEVRDAADFLIVGPPELAPEGERMHPVEGWRPKGEAAGAGRVAGEAIRQAVELAMRREVNGLVTAPIDKHAFQEGGWRYPGHTEMLRDLAAVAEVGMMMAAERTLGGGPLRVVLATTHLPLRDVPETLTTELLVSQTRLTARSLRRWWGITEPRLALCAFNPHASDGGLFGDEEERIYAPAMEELRRDGVRVTGPVPADTVFSRAIRGEFDAVVAPYHDVGMAAFKTVAFGSGVNVTLGLPFPRTSPDHGTALDIAGKNAADEGSMVEAILLAARLAESFDTPRRSR